MRIQQVWQKSLKGFSPGVQLFVDTCHHQTWLFVCMLWLQNRRSFRFISATSFYFPSSHSDSFFSVSFYFSSSPRSLEIQKNWRATFFKKYKQKCNHIFWTPGTGFYTVHASLERWAKLLLLGHALEDVFNLYKLSVKVNLRSDGIDH